MDLSRLSDEDCFEPSWVPLGLKISRTDAGQITVEEIADDVSIGLNLSANEMNSFNIKK